MGRDRGAQTVLEDAGMVPSATRTYDVGRLQRALTSAWGVQPVVKCTCPGGPASECEEALLESVRSRARAPAGRSLGAPVVPGKTRVMLDETCEPGRG